MKKRMQVFSMIPLCICLLAAFLPGCHAAAQVSGYDLKFYFGGGMVLLLTALLTALLAVLVFAKTKMNRFGEVCASLMVFASLPCSAALLFTAQAEGAFFAGLWIIGWTAAAFHKRVLSKGLRWGMGIIGGLAAWLCILGMTGVLYLTAEYPELSTERGREQACYVSSVSPDGSEIAEAYFSNGMPHLRVRENNDGIDLKIARLTKQPTYIRFVGSGAIERIEWKDENTLWIDDEAEYPIDR